jgi:hypothetical protein
MLSEAERRWPDFQGGRPIRLPNGEDWHFYDPEPAGRDWTFGPDVLPAVNETLSRRLHRILAKWQRATTDADRASSILEASWFLLARNYNVTQEEFEAILSEDDGQVGEVASLLLAHVGIVCGRSVLHAREAI